MRSAVNLKLAEDLQNAQGLDRCLLSRCYRVCGVRRVDASGPRSLPAARPLYMEDTVTVSPYPPKSLAAVDNPVTFIPAPDIAEWVVAPIFNEASRVHNPDHDHLADVVENSRKGETCHRSMRRGKASERHGQVVPCSRRAGHGMVWADTRLHHHACCQLLCPMWRRQTDGACRARALSCSLRFGRLRPAKVQ